MAPATALAQTEGRTQAIDLRYTDAPRVAADVPRSELSAPRGVGDVNGDGRPDLVASLRPARRSAAQLRVLFMTPFQKRLAMSSQPGFDIRRSSEAQTALRYAAAGDVNGDGLADVVVTQDDRAYILYGSGSQDEVDLEALGERGFVVEGLDVGGRIGDVPLSAAGFGAGDINGDGLADLVVGSPGSDPGGRSQAGSAFVIFGSRGSETVDVRALGARGYRINGVEEGDHLGLVGSPLGDVNGDTRPDLAIGGEQPQPEFTDDPVWIVRGESRTGELELAQPGASAYRISGLRSSSGVPLAGPGDVNGDGLAEVLLASEGTGAFYLVRGSSNEDGLDVTGGEAGVTTLTNARSDSFDRSVVAGPGDATGDGLADLVVGGLYSGGVWFVEGSSDLPSAVNLNRLGERGFLVGPATNASRFGDLDGDGRAELLLGGYPGYRCHASQETGSGSAFVLPGRDLPPRIEPHGRYSRESDRLSGTSGDDVIFGARGNDRLRGRAGHDCITGGVDDYHDATESDWAPRPDNDRVFGGPGRDLINGGAAQDFLSGGPGADVLYDGLGRDRVAGGAGDDYLIGDYEEYVPGGRDLLAAGAGDDQIFSVDLVKDVVDCGPGRDRVQADRNDRLRRCERVRRIRDHYSADYPYFE